MLASETMQYPCIGLMLGAAAVACERASRLAYSNVARSRASSAPIDPHRLYRARVLQIRSSVPIGMLAGCDETREFQIEGGPPTTWSYSGSIYPLWRQIYQASHRTNSQ